MTIIKTQSLYIPWAEFTLLPDIKEEIGELALTVTTEPSPKGESFKTYVFQLDDEIDDEANLFVILESWGVDADYDQSPEDLGWTSKDPADAAADEQWMADHEAGDIGPAPWKGEF